MVNNYHAALTGCEVYVTSSEAQGARCIIWTAEVEDNLHFWAQYRKKYL